MQLPDIKQLVYFREVARAGNFGRAARSLGISPSALTESIQRLEKVVGQQLLFRDRKGVLITKQGAIFLDHADAILDRVDDAMNAARSGVGDATPRLHFGLSSAASGSALPTLLRTLREQVPGLHFQVSETRAIDAEKALLEEGLDCLFISYPPPSDQLTALLIDEIPLFACVPLDHPLGEKEVIHLVDLDDREIIFVGQYPHRRAYRAFFDACEKASASPRLSATVKERQSLLTLVASGIGIGILHGGTIPSPELQIACRPLGDPQLSMPLNMVYNSDIRNPVIDRLRQIVRDRKNSRLAENQMNSI